MRWRAACPPNCLMAELYGKASGCSHGRGGSMHFFDVAKRFYGGYAIVGGGLPIAVGLALADKMQGRQRVTACFFGDGAVAEGEFHESMNLAKLWELPVLFLCENNLYAMGTALGDLAVGDGHRLQGAGLRTCRARQWTAWTSWRWSLRRRGAAERIRQGSGPELLEMRTYRFRGHSLADPELYRSKEEVQRWQQHDPIADLRTAAARGRTARPTLTSPPLRRA